MCTDAQFFCASDFAEPPESLVNESESVGQGRRRSC